MEQQEASDDAVMTRIGQAIMLLHGGDREEARNRFGALWSELGADGDALHRCTLAHYMADTQDDPGDELAWDLRALTAAEGLRAAEGPGGGEGAGGARAAEHRDTPAVRAFYPRCTSTSRRTTSSSSAPNRPVSTSSGPAPRPYRSRTTGTAVESAPPSTAWSSACGRSDPAGRAGAGASAAVRPRADAGLRTARGPAAVPPAERADVRPADADTRQCGHGDGGDVRDPARRPGPRRVRTLPRTGGPRRSGARSLRRGGDGRGCGEDGRAADGLGSGTASNTSRAGDCTICGATSWAGPVAPGRGEGRARGSTDTQPEMAVTVSPTRRFAVILVLCTRTTLRCGPVFGDPVGGEWPARVTRSARRPARARQGRDRQSPVAPSTRSRTRSAWPLCRAYSSIMCR